MRYLGGGPPAHLRLEHSRCGLKLSQARFDAQEEALARRQGLLGLRQFLLRVSPALANSKRIALHDVLFGLRPHLEVEIQLIVGCIGEGLARIEGAARSAADEAARRVLPSELR